MEDWYIIVGVFSFLVLKAFCFEEQVKVSYFHLDFYFCLFQSDRTQTIHCLPLKMTINQGRTNKNPSAIDSRIIILTNNLLVHHESDVIVALPVHPSIQLVCAVIWYIFAISRCCAPQILNALVVLCEKLGPTDDYKPVGSWPAIEAWGHKNVNKLHQMHLLIEI